MTGRLDGCMVNGLVDSMIFWLDGCLFCCMVWLDGCLAVVLFGWFVQWLVVCLNSFGRFFG